MNPHRIFKQRIGTIAVMMILLCAGIVFPVSAETGLPEHLQAGLKLHYDFEASTPTAIWDLTGARRSVTAAADVRMTDGVRGKAVHFSGGGGLLVEEHMDLAFEGAFSVAFWVRTDVAIEQMKKQQIYVGKDNWDTKSGWLVLCDRPWQNGILFRTLRKRASDSLWRGSLQPGEWTHFAAVNTGGVISLLVNGKRVLRKNGNVPLRTKSPLTIGKGVQGALDDLCIWGRALHEGEVRDHLNATRGADGPEATGGTVVHVDEVRVLDHVPMRGVEGHPAYVGLKPPEGMQLVYLRIRASEAAERPQVRAALRGEDGAEAVYVGMLNRTGTELKWNSAFSLRDEEAVLEPLFAIPAGNRTATLSLYDTTVAVKLPDSPGMPPRNHLIEHLKGRITRTGTPDTSRITAGAWPDAEGAGRANLHLVELELSATRWEGMSASSTVSLSPRQFGALIGGEPARVIGNWQHNRPRYLESRMKWDDTGKGSAKTTLVVAGPPRGQLRLFLEGHPLAEAALQGSRLGDSIPRQKPDAGKNMKVEVKAWRVIDQWEQPIQPVRRQPHFREVIYCPVPLLQVHVVTAPDPDATVRTIGTDQFLWWTGGYGVRPMAALHPGVRASKLLPRFSVHGEGHASFERANEAILLYPYAGRVAEGMLVADTRLVGKLTPKQPVGEASLAEESRFLQTPE